MRSALLLGFIAMLFASAPASAAARCEEPCCAAASDDDRHSCCEAERLAPRAPTCVCRASDAGGTNGTSVSIAPALEAPSSSAQLRLVPPQQRAEITDALALAPARVPLFLRHCALLR